MPAYLQLLDIAEAEEFELNPSAYVKIVNIVEVLNESGEPYVPPVSDVTVVTASKILQESDDVMVGTPATWSGGSDQTYEYAWNFKGENQAVPIYITSWQSYDNTATPTPEFTATEVGQYQFVSRAKSGSDSAYTHSVSPKVYVSSLS